jgi:hypothetical protein
LLLFDHFTAGPRSSGLLFLKNRPAKQIASAAAATIALPTIPDTVVPIALSLSANA